MPDKQGNNANAEARTFPACRLVSPQREDG